MDTCFPRENLVFPAVRFLTSRTLWLHLLTLGSLRPKEACERFDLPVVTTSVGGGAGSPLLVIGIMIVVPRLVVVVVMMLVLAPLLHIIGIVVIAAAVALRTIGPTGNL